MQRKLRTLASLAAFLWTCLAAAGQPQDAMPLDAWRAEVEQLWIAMENDTGHAFQRAQWLQAHLPADATKVDEARVLNALARSEIYLSYHRQGIKHAREARNLAASLGDKTEQAKADIVISIGAIYASDIDMLTESTVHGMKILDGLDRPDLLGEVLLRTAMMYRRKGQLEVSINMCMRAMDIARRKANPTALAYAHHCLAVSYDQSGRFETARQHYTEMISAARQIPSKVLEVAAMLGLATTITNLESPAKAEGMIREAALLCRNVGAIHLHYHALSRLADNLRLQGRHKESLSLYQQVVAHFEQSDTKIPLWWTLEGRSREYRALGRYHEEVADVERAYSLAQEIGLPPLRSEGARRLAEVRADQGNLAQAYKLSQEALTLARQAEDATSADRMDQLAEHYQSESKQKQIDELTRREQQQAMQLRLLATVMGSAVVLLLVTGYFLVRLRRSQNALQHQTEILQSILDSMGDGVVVTSDRGKVLLANPMAASMLGVTSSAGEETCPTGFPLHLPPTGSGTANAELPLIRALTEQSSDGMEIYVDDPGRIGGRWVNKTVRPVTEKNGETHVMVAVFSDISAHKHALELTRRTEREFRTLAENSLDVIVRYDRECRRTYLNPAFERVTGNHGDHLVGTRIMEAEWRNCVNMKAGEFVAALRRAMASGMPSELILEWRSPDGRVLTHVVSVVPERMWGSEVSGVLTVARDITALKEAEHRQAEAYAMLRQLAARRETAREEERGRIARELHDELGQLITALRLGISSLRMTFGADNPKLAKQVASLVELADKALQGVRDVATLLRPPVLDMGIVAALEWLTSEFSQHTGIVCKLSVPPQAVELDKRRSSALFRLVQESLTNVARHAEARHVLVSIEAKSNGYRIEVRDDGVGFDPNRIAKRSYGLMGIRERSTLLGGEVTIDSAPGQGTTIRVFIPFEPQQALAS